MKVLIRIIFILSIPALIAFGTYRFMRFAFLDPLNPNDSSTTIVEIARGMTLSDISRRISEDKILRYPWTLQILARLRKVDKKMIAGEYSLSPSMTPNQVLAKLLSGEIVKRQVLVKEGASIFEVGMTLEQAGVINEVEFNRALVDQTLLARAGIPGSSFEGYLFPETYYFSRPITAEQIIWRMIEEGENHWKPDFTDKADELRLSRHEILTLASIIEKESGDVDEQPIISSVFHNRINQGMKLQSDPTVIYGLTNFDGNLTKEDLQNPHQYNTYVYYGLPPSPICNAGESAMRAALFPAKTSYLFFVADGTGKHTFSTTLQEHNEAVGRYVRSLAAAKAASSSSAAAELLIKQEGSEAK